MPGDGMVTPIKIVVRDDSRWVRTGYVGRILGPVYLIRQQYANDAGWNAHEQAHCRSCLRRWIVAYYLRYRFGRNFRLAEEAAAYHAQWLAESGGQVALHRYADLLAGPLYGLGLTHQAACNHIREGR